MSREEGRGFHVEGDGTMSRARVPCRGSRIILSPIFLINNEKLNRI